MGINSKFSKSFKANIVENYVNCLALSTIGGIDDNTKLTNLLKVSRWNRMKNRFFKLLAVDGISGLALLPVILNGEIVENSWYITEFKVISYQGDPFEPLLIWGVINDTTDFENKNRMGSASVYIKISNDKAKNWIYEIYTATSGIRGNIGINDPLFNTYFSKVNDPVSLNTARIPAIIVEHGYDSSGILDKVDRSLWELLDLYSSQFKLAWEYDKNILYHIGTSDNLNTTAAIKKKIESGERIIGLNSSSMDNGTPLAPIVKGLNPNETGLLWANLNTIRDEIYRQSFAIRDTLSTGTNKHNLEVAKSDEYVLKKLLIIVKLLSEQLENFFNFVVNDILKTGEVSVNWVLSDIDVNKLVAYDPIATPKVQLEGDRIRAQATVDARVEAAMVTAEAALVSARAEASANGLTTPTPNSGKTPSANASTPSNLTGDAKLDIGPVKIDTTITQPNSQGEIKI